MLAQIETLRDHGAQAAEWAAAALDGDIDPAQASQTRAIRANALLTAGQVQAALACFADLPADPGEVEVRRHPELAMRGIDRTVLGDLVAGEQDLRVAGSLAHGDFSPFRLTARGTLALARFRHGDWVGAEVVAEEVVALAADMEQPWLAGYLHAIAALVPAGRGNWKIAQRHVDTAYTVAQTLEEPASAAYADDAAIFLAMCRGDPTAVVRRATRLRDRPAAAPHEPGFMTWPVHLVGALVQLGRLNEAEVELDHVEDLAHRRQHPSRIAAAARLRGQLADAHRDRHTARAKLEEAVSLGNDHVDADERAMTHLAYATFLRRRGERRAAIEQALTARQRYGELGATPFLTRADEILAACGAPTGSLHKRRDPLTPQERAVARLVASGRTNQQAADELVVSVKTVSFHLQNVYAKLDVHSRAQLAGGLGEASTT
jgi:ATP/maltotriose-dependent transcriptional regulator MalT